MTPEAERLLEQPIPQITPDRAVEVALRLFGVEGHATALESERDRNFLIEGSEGAFALKFGHPAEGSQILEMQAAALDHIAITDPNLPVPRNRMTLAGPSVAEEPFHGVLIPVRMLEFIDGTPLGQGVSSPALRDHITALMARLQHSLRGFFHPAAGRVLLWDLSHLSALRSKLHHLEESRRPLNELWLDRFDALIAPRLPCLRAQVIHNDFNPENLLAEGEHITGIIDFGDMVHGPLVADLAVAIGYQVLGDAEPIDVIEEMAASFSRHNPLEAQELEVLVDLVAGRLVQSLIIGDWRASIHADNTEYILDYSESTWRALQRLSESDPVESIARLTQRSMTATAPKEDLIEHRRRRFGPGLELSYDEPVHLANAEGVWMYGADGERFLDAYNNVPHVGHSHPAVAQAIARQATVLNTNTRYLVDDIVEYADRLSGLFPEGLDVVLFVNSGSEANDLAWRIARTVTDREGMVVTEHAYHGSTDLTMATSPEELRKADLRPWVGTVPAPDTRKGRGAEIGTSYAALLDSAVADLEAGGHQAAAFACDTIFSSDGIFDAPTGYFRGVAERIRSAGGLFIADEVQAGFGRVGERMWGFAGQGVTPDIVTLGKPMGNGYPVAAVVTTSAIVEAFCERGYFFSTFAGNSVAAAAGTAVLNVMESENLPAKSERLGILLRSKLTDLQQRHPAIVDVRGAGLFIGVEMQDEAVARWVVEQMRTERVLIGRTGIRGNVLKIRPPLAFEDEHADLVLQALDRVLSEMG